MKRFASLMMGVLAVASTAMAADFTVVPKQGWLDSKARVKTITLTFNGEVAEVDGTSIMKVEAPMNTGTYTKDDLTVTFKDKTISYTAKNNFVIGNSGIFSISSTDKLVAGDMKFTIPAGTYTVDGEAGPEIILNYILSETEPVKEITWEVTPAQGWLDPKARVKTITLTFDGEVTQVDGTSIMKVEAPMNTGTYTKDDLTVTFKDKTISYTAKNNFVIGNSGIFSISSTDKLVAGDMKFTIPAGSYAVDGVEGSEIVLNYILANEDPNGGGGDEPEPEPDVMTITPAADSHVNQLKEVVIKFPKDQVPTWSSSSLSNGAIYWNSLTNGKYTGIGSKCGLSVRDNSLVIALPADGLAPGKYEFSFSSYKVNGKSGEELNFNIYVDAPNLENAQEFTPTINPNPVAIQSMLKTLTLTFNEGDEVVYSMPFNGGVQYSWESAEAAAAPTNGDWFANDWPFGGCYAEGNKLVLANSASSGISIPEGKDAVYLYVAGGTFMVNGVYNKPMNLKYYFKAPDFFDFDAEPVEGTVMALDQMSLDFFDVNPEEMTFEVIEGAKGQIKRNGVVMDKVYVGFNAFDNFLEMVVVDSETNERTAVQQPGHYQVVIPAGSFLIEGLGNAETVLNYEIAYQASEYTVNPADGATIRGISRLVVTFDEDMVAGTTEEATYLNISGAKLNAEYSAEGNVLTVELATPLFASIDAEGNTRWNGAQSVTIPEGFYTLDLDNGLGAREGAEIKLNYTFDYTVAPSTFDFKATPEQGVVESLGGDDPILVEFYNATSTADITVDRLSPMLMIEGAQLLLDGEAVENAEVMAALMYGGENYEMQVMVTNEEGNAFTEVGKYQIVIPAESFYSYGIANEKMTLSYEIVDMATVFEYTVEPAEGEVEFIPTPILSFTNVKYDNGLKVAEPKAGYVNRNGEKMEEYYVFFESFFNGEAADFNVLISANAEDPSLQAYISEPGKYEIVIPAGSFTIYGKNNEEIALNYEIVDVAALFDYKVTPAEGVVKSLGGLEETDGITVDFYNATSRADMDQNPMLEGVQLLCNEKVVENAQVFAGVAFNSEAECSQLTVTVADENDEAFTAPGEYEIVIPADSFFSHGKGNPEIKLSYEILDEATLFNYELVSPEGEIVYNFDLISLAFMNAKSEGSLVINDPKLCAISRSGAYIDGVYPFVMSEFYEDIPASALNLVFSSNETELDQVVFNQPGDYVVFIPEGVFSIYGVENKEINLSFKINYPFVEYTANPSDGSDVKEISSIVITFNEGEDEEYAEENGASVEVFEADNANYVMVDGELTPATYVAENNTLTITLEEPIESVEGQPAKKIVVTIPADLYKVRTSAMSSMAEPLYGPEIELTFSLDFTTGVANIAADGVKVTVYDAQGRVILKDADAKELDQLKGLYIVNGQKQIRK